MVAAAGGSAIVSARAAVATAAWIAVSILALFVLYQRVMLVNRVPMPKTPEALQDRAVETLAKLGYTEPAAASAWGLGFSQDYARFVEATVSGPNRWDRLRASRPESSSSGPHQPRALVPFGARIVSGTNPPLNASGMTLLVVDASGGWRSSCRAASVRKPDAHSRTQWSVLFESAGSTWRRSRRRRRASSRPPTNAWRGRDASRTAGPRHPCRSGIVRGQAGTS
jgi:hypothetical protein